MRKYAGAFLRRKKLAALAWEMILPSVVLGFLIGIWAVKIFGFQLGAYFFISAGVLLAVIFSRGWGKWRFKDVEKGLASETRAGQAIEYALTVENCAVAHSVTSIAKIGDIDHLVATPAQVWVVETKFRRVPSKDFRKVLHRLATNVRAVRRWAPSNTPIQGCLVLVNEKTIKRDNYLRGKEQIVVHTPKSLMQALKREAKQPHIIDKRIAKAVWELSRADE